MIKFIVYHFYHLFNKKWFFFLVLLLIASFFVLFYLGGGFEDKTTRLLNEASWLKEYENESFLIINSLIGFWIIGASKEMFFQQTAFVVLINKKKYTASKIISYWFYYLLIIIFVYGNYQIVRIILYDFRPFDYTFLINLIINGTIVHLLITTISGKSKQIIATIIFYLAFLITAGLYMIDLKINNYILFFIPFLSLEIPMFGYLHIVFYLLLVYCLAVYKHSNDYV